MPGLMGNGFGPELAGDEGRGALTRGAIVEASGGGLKRMPTTSFNFSTYSMALCAMAAVMVVLAESSVTDF